MAWVPPYTFVDGPGNRASGEEVMANMQSLATYAESQVTGMYVQATASPSLTTSLAAVTLAAATEVGADWWSSGTNPSRITAPESGVYAASLLVTPPSGKAAGAVLRVQGAVNIAGNYSSLADFPVSCAGLWVASAGDYIQAMSVIDSTTGTGAVILTVSKLPTS